ncbi:MAG: SLC13 family permease [Ardenticatenia bacterium]|nr:MAG: SLC13 family permease [Ardenticatenia bacterium]
MSILDPALITLLTLGMMVVLTVGGWLRADLAALLSVVALGLSGVLTPQEAFSGFSRSAVITILAVFILADALQRTGATEHVASFLLRLSRSRESWLVVLTMLAGALLSLFMNNIAAAAVLLPAVASAGQRARVSPSRLLMPLAFGTIVGGMATLLTTANIIASGLLRDRGVAGYGLLDFAPLGLPIIALALLYMALLGRHLLPAQSPAERMPLIRQQEKVDLVDVYRLDEHLFRARIPYDSPLVDISLAQSALRERYGLTVVGIERGRQVILAPSPHETLRPGDVLVFSGPPSTPQGMDRSIPLELFPPSEWREADLQSPSVAIVEAVLAPRSALIGRTLRETNFREKYDMTVLAVLRGSQCICSDLADLPLQFGDALLLQGPRNRLRLLQDDADVILLANGREAPPPTGRRRLALGVLGLTLTLAAIFPALVGEIMLGGALVMVLIGIISMDSVYQAIEWKTIFLVAGLLPLGIAITKTGIAVAAAQQMVTFLGEAGPLAILAGLAFLALLIAQVINSAAVVTVLTPIAIHIAQQIGADPRAMTMGVVLAASMTFLTPFGHPVNILVMGPGGYQIRDYLKVGLPMSVFLFAAILLLLPILWPLNR